MKTPIMLLFLLTSFFCATASAAKKENPTEENAKIIVTLSTFVKIFEDKSYDNLEYRINKFTQKYNLKPVNSSISHSIQGEAGTGSETHTYTAIVTFEKR